MDLSVGWMIISLNVVAVTYAYYCSDEVPSISFCQSGTVWSTLAVFINGSSVKTKEEFGGKECYCHVVQNDTRLLVIDGKDSCSLCGLDIKTEGYTFRSQLSSSVVTKWGFTTTSSRSFTLTMSISETISTAIAPGFCLRIQSNDGISLSLTLTCEGLDRNSSSTTLKATTLQSSKVLNTTVQQPTTPASKSEVSTKYIVDHDDSSTNKTTASKPSTEAETVKGSNEVIIPAAAGGGAGALILISIVVVVCCLRKTRKDTSQAINVDASNIVMTENPTYGTKTEISMKSVPQGRAGDTGDVYSVVCKGGNSNVPRSEVPHMQVGEAGDIYAVVNKESTQAMQNRGQSRGEGATYIVQTGNRQENDTAGGDPSHHNVSIVLDNTGPRRPVIIHSPTGDYAEMSFTSEI